MGSATDWAGPLAEAADEAQVVAVCQGDRKKRPEALLALSPEGGAPQLRTSNDVAEHALRLVKAQCGRNGASRALDTTAAFFAAASTRLSQILGRPTQQMFGSAPRTGND